MSEELISSTEIEKQLRAGNRPLTGWYGNQRIFQILEMISFGDWSSFELYYEPWMTFNPFEEVNSQEKTNLDVPQKTLNLEPFSELAIVIDTPPPPKRYIASIVRWHYPSLPLPETKRYKETYTAYLDTDVIEGIITRFNAVQVPFCVIPKSEGLDGTMYEMQFGDSYMYQMNIQWWSHFLPEWKPFYDLVDEVIDHMEKMANAPKQEPLGP